jgi:uncharacterized membrane protein
MPWGFLGVVFGFVIIVGIFLVRRDRRRGATSRESYLKTKTKSFWVGVVAFSVVYVAGSYLLFRLSHREEPYTFLEWPLRPVLVVAVVWLGALAARWRLACIEKKANPAEERRDA